MCTCSRYRRALQACEHACSFPEPGQWLPPQCHNGRVQRGRRQTVCLAESSHSAQRVENIFEIKLIILTRTIRQGFSRCGGSIHTTVTQLIITIARAHSHTCNKCRNAVLLASGQDCVRAYVRALEISSGSDQCVAIDRQQYADANDRQRSARANRTLRTCGAGKHENSSAQGHIYYKRVCVCVYVYHCITCQWRGVPDER